MKVSSRPGRLHLNRLRSQDVAEQYARRMTALRISSPTSPESAAYRAQSIRPSRLLCNVFGVRLIWPRHQLHIDRKPGFQHEITALNSPGAPGILYAFPGSQPFEKPCTVRSSGYLQAKTRPDTSRSNSALYNEKLIKPSILPAKQL